MYSSMPLRALKRTSCAEDPFVYFQLSDYSRPRSARGSLSGNAANLASKLDRRSIPAFPMIPLLKVGGLNLNPTTLSLCLLAVNKHISVAYLSGQDSPKECGTGSKTAICFHADHLMN